MPHPRSVVSATGLPPVPVAVLLPSPTHRHTADAARDTAEEEAGGQPDWCGVTPRDAAGLIARYSRPGDAVVELGAHPTITGAARHLGRRPAAPPAEGANRATQPGGAGLILAVLPRADTGGLELPGVSAAMLAWRAALRPGGYLLTALTPPGPDHAVEHGVERSRDSFRATVITAARTAGLTWQQEFLVVTAPLPAEEPRAMSDTAVSAPTVLVDGRHRPVHVKVLAFCNEKGEATDA